MKVSNLTAEIKIRNNTGEFLDGLIDILQEFECSDDLGRRIISLVQEHMIVEVAEEKINQLSVEELRQQFEKQLHKLYDTSYQYRDNKKVYCSSQTKNKFNEWLTCAKTINVIK